MTLLNRKSFSVCTNTFVFRESFRTLLIKIVFGHKYIFIMGSSISKGRKTSSKVLPEIPAVLEELKTGELEVAPNKATEVLPPLRITLSNQTALPAIVPRVQQNPSSNDTPNWTSHVNDDDEDDFQNALEADLQLNLDNERANKDDENVWIDFY